MIKKYANDLGSTQSGTSTAEVIMTDMVIPITVQNISNSYPQRSWISMGLPASVDWPDGMNGVAKTTDGRVFQAARRGQELFVEVDLKPNEGMAIECVATEIKKLNFQYSQWVVDELSKIIPRFRIKVESNQNDSTVTTYESLPMTMFLGGAKPKAYYTLEEDSDVRKRFFFHTRIEEAHITIEGWIDVFSNQDVAPIIIRATYGTIDSPAVLNQKFGSFSMISGERSVIDFRRAKGLHDPVWLTDIKCWETELASPRLWWKSRVIECFGAMLCLPPYDQLGSYLANPEFINRINSLKAREEAPCAGVVNSWEGQWLAFGKVPELPTNVNDKLQAAYYTLVRRLSTQGDEYNQRDYAQPPNSGQTGSQPDFGASRGELAVAAHQPFALWDYRFSVQAWMLRPYAHKTKDGYPVQAKDHPGTMLWNMAPDTRFGTDLLGWPNPIPYNEFWTGSDNQHRSDNLLFAMYALTRDPSIKATIQDLVQCSLMELKTYQLFGPPNGTVSSPRGWGRPLLSMAHMVSLGFNEVKSNLIEMVGVMYKGASMMKIPVNDESLSVRTLSNDGFKYGWNNLDGSPIRAWICWEESIAAMGLWAAWKVTGDERAKELALEVSKTITKHAFFKENNRWYACYAVRWDSETPGLPLPESCYKLTAIPEDNKDVMVYGMQQWLLPSLRLVVDQLPDSEEAIRASEIINFFGPRPADFNDSAWWAVV